jgi:xanthine phosphoribosyltransferase
LFGTNDPEEETKRRRQQQEEEEREFKRRLSTVTLRSDRLERARSNSRAAAYFGQEPDVIEGYDRCWVSAIDNACFKNLKGNLRNYGVQFLDNFGDYEDGRVEDMVDYTIEEIASFKARQVYEVTGLPCVASRTSWEVEPIPNFNTGVGGSGGYAGKSLAGGPGASGAASPRVASGYRFNDVGVHVDYISDALRPLSEPSRVTQFRTCLCYYDGEMEVYDYGVAEIDLVFCNSLRTFIPVSAAINEMVKTLELTFGLEYQPWLKKRVDGASSSTEFGSAASMKLRDRVLKEGRVLPNDIIDVSRFMDSMVDVELMDECAKELSNRFFGHKPNKVITVATTGLVIALPIAKYLQVPLVYARKERSVVMADTYKASYSSKTVGKNRELLVSRDHLDEDDRVLVVDDFLSSGSSQEALLRIVAESGATAVGVGVLLEKVYESGRQSLSGFDVPIHSLCRVASLQSGVIQLVEEEGFDRMNQQKKKAQSTLVQQ